MMHARALFYWKINEIFWEEEDTKEEGAKYFELYFYFLLTALYKRDRD